MEKMKSELNKIPDEFIDIKYDDRNRPQAGKFRGVGLPFKVGTKHSTLQQFATEGAKKPVPPLKFE